MKKCCTCQEQKPESEFNKNKGRIDGLNSICRLCSNIRSKQYYAENRTHHKTVTFARNQVMLRKCKLIALSFRQQGCKICYEDDPCCIDAHHKDASIKDSNIAELVRRRAYKKLISELEKCIPLCSNCHRKLHRGHLSLLKS